MKNSTNINNNTITFDGHSDTDHDYKKLLAQSNSLVYKKCSGVNINIESTINKIIFKNCNNCSVKLSKSLSGVEIINSSDITIDIYENSIVYHIDIDGNSNIILKVKPNDLKNIKFSKETKSKIVVFKK